MRSISQARISLRGDRFALSSQMIWNVFIILYELVPFAWSVT